MASRSSKLPVADQAKLAFYLAILVLLLPLHADLLVMVVAQTKRVDLAILVSAVCIGVVLVPTLVAAIMVFGKDRAYRGRGYLYPAMVLILLNMYLAWMVIGAMRHAQNKQRHGESKLRAPGVMMLGGGLAPHMLQGRHVPAP